MAGLEEFAMYSLTSVPQTVQQNRDKNHCWAAALFSWMLATGRKGNSSTPIKTYKDLVNQYSDLEDGGISEKALKGAVSDDFNMGKSLGTWDLSETGIENILRQKGYMLLVYKSGMQSSHTLVVYGVGNGKIKYMDPWYGELRDCLLTDFNANAKTPPMAKMMMWPE